MPLQDGFISMWDEIRRITLGYDVTKSDDKKTVDAIEKYKGGKIDDQYTSGSSGLIGEEITAISEAMDTTMIIALVAGVIALFVFITD